MIVNGGTGLTGSLVVNGGTPSATSTIAIRLGGGLGTGTLNLDGGILRVGAGGTAGSDTAMTVQDAGSVLNVNRSDDVTLAQTIAGLGSVTKSGTDNLVLSSNNAFAGLGIGSNAGNVRRTSNTAVGIGTITVNGQNAVTRTAGTDRRHHGRQRHHGVRQRQRPVGRDHTRRRPGPQRLGQ